MNVKAKRWKTAQICVQRGERKSWAYLNPISAATGKNRENTRWNIITVQKLECNPWKIKPPTLHWRRKRFATWVCITQQVDMIRSCTPELTWLEVFRFPTPCDFNKPKVWTYGPVKRQFDLFGFFCVKAISGLAEGLCCYVTGLDVVNVCLSADRPATCQSMASAARRRGNWTEKERKDDGNGISGFLVAVTRDTELDEI